jgi:hypothetical protein
MYAAASFAVGSALRSEVIIHFARVWVWIALAAWMLIAAATLRRGWWLVHGAPPAGTSANSASEPS